MFLDLMMIGEVEFEKFSIVVTILKKKLIAPSILLSSQARNAKTKSGI